MSDFKWTRNRENAAIALADGYTIKEAAKQANVVERTVYRWLDNPEFSEEVDRLALITGIALKAERIKIAKRVVREKIQSGDLSEKDLLDWLKFSSQETDGVFAEILLSLNDGS